MSENNCSVCEDLKQADPNLVVNGIGTTECASLRNDTGLSPSSGHDDCDDLNLLNDCLVGRMDKELNAYNSCDWKEFMHNFIPNVWTAFKALICAICGLWTNVHNIWTSITQISASITDIYNKIANINTEISTMPHEFLHAEVHGVVTVPGDNGSDTINISASRSDGFIPIGIVGWNFSNEGSSTGVSKVFPFEAKLQGTDARFQLTNTGSSSCTVRVSAIVIYYRARS